MVRRQSEIFRRHVRKGEHRGGSPAQGRGNAAHTRHARPHRQGRAKAQETGGTKTSEKRNTDRETERGGNHHSRQLLDMQQKHINELAQTENNLKREISRLTVLLNKTLKWFPQIKEMLNLERLCLAVGFSKEQTATLLTGKPVEYSGELYSEEHKRKFMAKDVKAKVFSDNGRFVLTIDLRPIGEWFRERLEKIKVTIK